MTRADLEASTQFKPVPLDVPGLPSPIHVRPWSILERGELLRWRQDHDDYTELCVMMFALSACDPNGDRLYTTSPDDLAAVGKLDAKVVEAVATRAFDLNGLGADGPKA